MVSCLPFDGAKTADNTHVFGSIPLRHAIRPVKRTTGIPEVCGPPAITRRDPLAPMVWLLRRVVLDEGGLELAEYGVRVHARLAHAVGPDLRHRLRGLAPLAELSLADRVHLTARRGIPLQLGDSRSLEIGPRGRDAKRPFSCAVVVDGLFLRR